MRTRHVFGATAFVAAMAALGGGGAGGAAAAAWAAEGAIIPPVHLSLEPPAGAPSGTPIAAPPTPAAATPAPQPEATAAATERRPLMMGLDRLGLAQPLDAARVEIYGTVEGSYQMLLNRPLVSLKRPLDYDEPFKRDIDQPPGITGRLFDYRQDQKVLLNRVDFNLERTVNPLGREWDVGFRVESMYGSDARFIHANGFQYFGQPLLGPEYQLDLTQAYVDVAAPVGTGLRVRAGKFLYFLNLDPNYSLFYTHSYWWTTALPYTLTGVTADYFFSERLDLEVGISRGWNQSLRDNNGAIDGFARVTWDFTDKASATFAVISGPEFSKIGPGFISQGDNSHYLTAGEVNLSYRATDALTLYLDGVFGHKARTARLAHSNINFVVLDEEVTAEENRAANYYGLTGQAAYRVNSYVTLAGRAEWYRDEEDFTLGTEVLVPRVPPGQGAEQFLGNVNYYEATLGATITPFPNEKIGKNFKLRPEVRFDLASKAAFPFQRHFQSTFAIDAIFNF